MKNLFFLTLLLAFAVSANAADVNFKKVNDNVYAFIGETEDRTPENLGLNANIGLVITDAGAVLIDSGAGPISAQAIEKGVKKVTDKKVIAVFNTGSQDHRWLGNDYFAKKGAQIYAMQRTVNTQKEMVDSILNRIMAAGDIFKDQTPFYAPKPIQEDSAQITIGNTVFEMKFFNDAHFPGDIVIWLPKQQVLFSGDHVYVDRLMGVLPYSNASKWLDAFQQLIKLPAKYIVPGHGRVASPEQAKLETGAYLEQLVKSVKEAVENMEPMSVVNEKYDWSKFKHLKHFDSWHGVIISNTYQLFEMENF